MRALIVGIDPGTTSAVAALDLNGEVVMLESRRDFRESEIIWRIVEKGMPLLVASDRGKTPSKVKSICSSLGAELYEPENDLTSERKDMLGSGRNEHQKDAEAAARHAFRDNRNRLAKCKSRIEGSEDEAESLAEHFNGRVTRV